MGDVTFFSRHRKLTIGLANEELIRFRPTGMIGTVTVTADVAKRLRKHKLFQATREERGAFYEQKPTDVQEKDNIVQGTKGAGSGRMIMDDTSEVPSNTDEEKVATPPKKKKKKSTKKKNSKKK